MSLPNSGGLFFKGYKELLRKSVSGHDVPDGSVLPSNATVAMLRLAHPDVSFNRAFSRLKDAVLGEAELSGGIRARWRASKTREQLRSALGSYLSHTAPGGDGAAAALDETAVAAYPDPALQPLLGRSGPLRSSVIYAVAQASRGFMTALNTTDVEGAEVMASALERPAGQALITVSNHVAAMDDPLVMATIIPAAYYTQPQNMRWTLCASDRCFKYRAMSAFFTAGKVLPIERGGGLRQAGMRAAEERLAAGDWVHVFPEGTRGTGGALGPIRRGVGSLVASCPQPPLVVPFVHSGMEAVLPRGRALPAVGQKVKVLVGEPIPVADLMEAASAQQWSEQRLQFAIAERVGRRLSALKSCLDGAHATVADAEAAALMAESAAAAASTSAAAATAAAAAASSGASGFFDPEDLSTDPASVWERLQFKRGHRQWLQASGVLPPPAASSGGAQRQQQGVAGRRRYQEQSRDRSNRIAMMMMGGAVAC